jgi:hypothetical protein
MRLEAGATAVAVAAAATFMCAGPAAAQQGDEPNVTLDVSPTSGPAGTVITVRGEDCNLTDVGLVAVLVNLEDEVPEIGDMEVYPDAGSWSAQPAVPQDAAPGDEIVVRAACGYFDSPTSEFTLVFAYEPVTFHVTGAPTTAPPTTPPPTPTPPAGPAPAPAPPAEPVVAEPTFTG